MYLYIILAIVLGGVFIYLIVSLIKTQHDFESELKIELIKSIAGVRDALQKLFEATCEQNDIDPKRIMEMYKDKEFTAKYDEYIDSGNFVAAEELCENWEPKVDEELERSM